MIYQIWLKARILRAKSSELFQVRGRDSAIIKEWHTYTKAWRRGAIDVSLCVMRADRTDLFLQTLLLCSGVEVNVRPESPIDCHETKHYSEDPLLDPSFPSFLAP